MQRLRALCDVDEVLGDFQSPASEVMARVTQRPYNPDGIRWDLFADLSRDELKAVFAEIERPGWCSAIQPKPGAVEFINELRTICDVFVVTSPFHSKTWVHERDAWLEERFGFKRHEIVYTKAKHLVVGDVFLDDNPKHVDEWRAAHPGKLGLLWHIPNTRLIPHQHRVHTWQEVLDKVRQFAKFPSVYDLLRKAEWRYAEMANALGMEKVCLDCGPAGPGAGHKDGCAVDAILTSVYGTDRGS
jgi:5'(3')-deoxyribonucleotidase